MKFKKILRRLLILLALAVVVFCYFRFYWVFGTGTKAGTLNSFMRKGYIFKTYEGKIIQSGFRENVQSNEFDFSVTDTTVARILLNNSGREMELHYREYFGALPWRGMQKDIVDSVYEIRATGTETILSPK